MPQTLRRQDSIREETEQEVQENQVQSTPDSDKTTLVNGYSDTVSSECQENITVISIDSDPLSSSNTSTVVQEQTTRVEEPVFEASEVVQVCDSSDMVVVQEESAAFYSVETVGSSESSMSDDAGVGLPVTYTEAAVQDCCEGSVSCAAELAHDDLQMCVVECVEEFEVATCTSDGYDSMSVCSLGSTENIVQTHDIVMECGRQVVEEVLMSPVEKAIIRRG